MRLSRSLAVWYIHHNLLSFSALLPNKLKLELTMSFAYSTLVGHEPRLPMFVTPLYQPYPLPPRSRRNRIRNLTPMELKNMAEEMASLSEEEYDYDSEVLL